MLNKLALRNARRSMRDYLVYLITMTAVAAMMFAFNRILVSAFYCTGIYRCFCSTDTCEINLFHCTDFKTGCRMTVFRFSVLHLPTSLR